MKPTSNPRHRRLPSLGDPKRFIVYRLPRCNCCGSHRLKTYKTDSSAGNLPESRFVECLDCGARAIAVGD